MTFQNSHDHHVFLQAIESSSKEQQQKKVQNITNKNFKSRYNRGEEETNYSKKTKKTRLNRNEEFLENWGKGWKERYITNPGDDQSQTSWTKDLDRPSILLEPTPFSA